MKKEVNPAIVGVVVVLLVAVVGFFLWKGTSGGGGLPVGTSKEGNRGKGPLFEWMNHPRTEPAPGSQDPVQNGPGRGGSSGGPPPNVSRPAGTSAGGGATR